MSNLQLFPHIDSHSYDIHTSSLNIVSNLLAPEAENLQRSSFCAFQIHYSFTQFSARATTESIIHAIGNNFLCHWSLSLLHQFGAYGII